MTDPLIGQNLGAYRVTELIKRTGMSRVYLARDDKLARDVVAKVMLSGEPDDPADAEAFTERFQQEALATARLSHPNIVHIYDFGAAGDLYYMVMEYLPGGSLYDRLVDAHAAGQRIEIAESVRITAAIADALDQAHRAGFIHRDVKPSNILFTEDGRPVLTDLGIVKTRDGPALTESLVAVGTPEYMSPEQGHGDPVDARSDIYSLGVVLFELLAGGLPFQAETTWALLYKHLYETPPALSSLNRAVSPALRSVVEKALAKAPGDRFATAREFVDALKRAEAAPGRRLYPAPPPPPAPDPQEFAAEIAQARAADTATKRATDRTDVYALPGRVTPRPPAARRKRWLPAVAAVALLLAAAAGAFVFAGGLDRLRAAPAATAALAAALPPPSATPPPATALPTAPPAATQLPSRTPTRPAPTRTVAAVATVAATLPVEAATDVPAPEVGVTPPATGGVSAELPQIVLAFADGERLTLLPYVDAGGRYSLYVPESWSQTPDALGVSFEAPDRQARVMIHEMLDVDASESAEAVGRRYVAGAQALFQRVREAQSGGTEIDGTAAFRQRLEAEVLTVPVKVELLALNADGNGLVVVGATAAASEPAYRGLLAAMLSSFRPAAQPAQPNAEAIAFAQATAPPPTLAPTFTLVPPTPTSTAPPTRTPIPTRTLTPTRTATPRVIGGRATGTATRAAVATAAPAAFPAPVLLAPGDNEATSGVVTFSWRWDGRPLGENEAFEVRVWKAGQSAHYGAAEPTQALSATFDVTRAYGPQSGGAGQYLWTVAVVQRNPYLSLGPEAAPRALDISFGGGGGGGASATWTPPPP